MKTSIRHTIEQCARQSYEGAIGFGEVVGNLIQAGVESYHADYRQPSTTYYLPTDENVSLALKVTALKISEEFDKDSLQNAIRGAQRAEVKYPQFIELSMKAGCVGYIVWIKGRYVTFMDVMVKCISSNFQVLVNSYASSQRNNICEIY